MMLSRRPAQIVGERPISQRLSEMHAAHRLIAIEVREGASDSQDAVITAGGKAHGVGRFAQQRKPSRVGLDDGLQHGAAGLRIGAHRAASIDLPASGGPTSSMVSRQVVAGR